MRTIKAETVSVAKFEPKSGGINSPLAASPVVLRTLG